MSNAQGSLSSAAASVTDWMRSPEMRLRVGEYVIASASASGAGRSAACEKRRAPSEKPFPGQFGRDTFFSTRASERAGGTARARGVGLSVIRCGLCVLQGQTAPRSSTPPAPGGTLPDLKQQDGNPTAVSESLKWTREAARVCPTDPRRLPPSLGERARRRTGIPSGTLDRQASTAHQVKRTRARIESFSGRQERRALCMTR